MMDKQLKIRVRPGESVRFPALCVACGRAAGERLSLTKRRGQVTRRLEAPLCGECVRVLARYSGQQERFMRLRWLAAAAVAILLLALALVALPIDLWWFRLMVGLAIGLPGGALIYWALTRRAEAAELPERRAVRQAARIVDFTWRDMTLAFTNQRVLDGVIALNPELVSGEVAGQQATPTAGTVDEEESAQEVSAPPAEESSVS